MTFPQDLPSLPMQELLSKVCSSFCLAANSQNSICPPSDEMLVFGPRCGKKKKKKKIYIYIYIYIYILKALLKSTVEDQSFLGREDTSVSMSKGGSIMQTGEPRVCSY